jgi:hypothetical protein
MKKKDRGAVELTILRLKDGFDLKDFIQVNKPIDKWMNKQPGFRARYMFLGSGERIFDLLFWDEEDQGHEAMSRLMEVFADSEVHAMIDQRSVDWFVAGVGHALLSD